MLDQLRGRNLAHVGCTLGLTAGLLLGLIAGLIVIEVMQNLAAVNVATIVWLGVTVVLGGLGYYLGGYVSRRLWGEKQRES
ncbi:MAG TPA: hypothetical protein VFU63_02055 [Ktedonobacterales bacterium]|nr:hypothetical protein [Ktedonobacterales bacterium]